MSSVPAGLSAVVARISELDTLVRRFDPGWEGTSLSSWAGMAASPAPLDTSGSAFSTVLATASAAPTGPASAVAPTAVAAPVDPASGFVSPLPGSRLTQAFGPTSFALEPPATVDGVRYAHYHDGLDLAAPLGTTVRASAAGTVVAAGRATDGAVIVRIRHAAGSQTLYGHLETGLPVSVGEKVQAGQAIGKVGITGNTTGPHLHFGLFDAAGQAIDPAPWLARGTLPGAAAAVRTGSPTPAGGTAGGAGESGRATTSALAQFDRVASGIPYAAQIRAAAVASDVDPLLLASLTRAESSFRPNAVSSCGAMGLTQLMPGTASSLGIANPFDPAQNLSGGARYLATQLHRFGRVDLALAAYQAGPTLVSRLGAVPNSTTTRSYVAHILGTWAAYREQSA